MKHELQVIADRGFSKYFLTMKAITDKTNEVQLSGPGRGSAAGSLVAYALALLKLIQLNMAFYSHVSSDQMRLIILILIMMFPILWFLKTL